MRQKRLFKKKKVNLWCVSCYRSVIFTRSVVKMSAVERGYCEPEYVRQDWGVTLPRQSFCYWTWQHDSGRGCIMWMRLQDSKGEMVSHILLSSRLSIKQLEIRTPIQRLNFPLEVFNTTSCTGVFFYCSSVSLMVLHSSTSMMSAVWTENRQRINLMRESLRNRIPNP